MKKVYESNDPQRNVYGTLSLEGFREMRLLAKLLLPDFLRLTAAGWTPEQITELLLSAGRDLHNGLSFALKGRKDYRQLRASLVAWIATKHDKEAKAGWKVTRTVSYSPGRPQPKKPIRRTIRIPSAGLQVGIQMGNE